MATFAGLIVCSLLVGWWIRSSERWRYYTDGISVRQSSATATLRLMLWEDPQQLPGRLNSQPDSHEPTVSADGRTMVFVRGSAGKNTDLYVTHWNGETWDDPQPITSINTLSDELSPALSRDGTLLYFSSNRPGGFGGYDLWVARWHESTWSAPVKLGLAVNSEFDETGPAPSPDGARLYFSSNRPKHERSEMDKLLGQKRRQKSEPTADCDIFFAEQKPTENNNDIPMFEAAERMDVLNSAGDERHVALTARGEFLYFCSNRKGGQGAFDIYRSRFLDGNYQPPENLGEPVNSSADDAEPALSMEGQNLVFSSNRNSPDLRDYYLYQSVSREVVARKDYSGLTPFVRVFQKVRWLVLILIVASIVLLYLLRSFLNYKWQVRVSLLQQCLFASGLLHVFIAFLLSLWFFTPPVYQSTEQPWLEVAIDEGTLASERVSLDIREQVSDLIQVPVPVPIQEKVEQHPLAQADPQKQEVKPESTPANLEKIAAAMPSPATNDKPAEKLQPVDRAREIPGTHLKAAVVQLETPRPIAPQTSSGTPSAPSTVEVRQVNVSDRAQSPVVAEVNVQTGGQNQNQQASRSAVESELPVAESQPSDSLAAANARAGSGMPDAPKLSSQVAMESGNPAKSQAPGPQIKPLSSGQSLAAAVAGSPVPQGKAQALAQQLPAGGSANGQGQRSALQSELPVSESQSTASLKPAATSSKAGDGMEIKTAVTMEAARLGASPGGAGPLIKPLQSDQNLASASNTPLPTSGAQKMTSNLGGDGTGTAQLQDSALGQNLPVSESPAGTARLSQSRSATTNAVEGLQLSAKLTMETGQPAVSHGAGVEIQPLPVAPTMASAAGGAPPMMQPQRLTQGVPAGGATQPSQLTALSQNVPVQESAGGSPLAAQGHSLISPVGALTLQSRVSMEAKRPARSTSSGQEGMLEQADVRVASAAELAVPSGQPQKTEQRIAAGELNGAFTQQSGPIRTVEFRPDKFESIGPGESTRLKIPALEMAAGVKFPSPSGGQSTYALRNQNQRQAVLQTLGGTAQTEKAIRRSLDWFTRNQEADGHWSIRRHGGKDGNDVGATALALLCYMGWGAKHTEAGQYQETVAKGIEWLRKQVRYTGDLRGPSGTMYDHGMGAVALAEAYGLTKDQNLYEPLRSVIAFIVKAQNPETGGWRYIPGESGDTSVFGWQMMALRSAALDGLDIPPHAVELANRWLDHVSGGQHGGLYGYQNKNPLPTMSAEAMFCQQLLGHPPTEPRMLETAEYLKSQMPTVSKTNYYYWYYGCLAMYQHQGPIWEEWNDKIRAILVQSQNLQDDKAGSWDPVGQWGKESGRAVVTAMATLSLEVYYRYLPLYGLTTAAR